MTDGTPARRLMCSPSYFDVVYEINPWMHVEARPDHHRAQQQWASLLQALRTAGDDIEVIDSQPGLPDMVFAANAGLLAGDLFVPSAFRFAQRRPESAAFAAWFTAHGVEVATDPIPPGEAFEGGDVFVFGDTIVGAHGFRSTPGGLAALAAVLGVEIVPLRLIDPRLYHLDACFCPIDSRRAIVAPTAFDAPSLQLLTELVPEPLLLEPDEAAQFQANSVVAGRTIVMPACSDRVRSILARWDYDVRVVEVTEFMKAGGAVRCLTLPAERSPLVSGRGGQAHKPSTAAGRAGA